MTTLTLTPATTKQIRHIGRLGSDAIEKVLEDLDLDKERVQLVHSRGDEFVAAIRKAAIISLKELSVPREIIHVDRTVRPIYPDWMAKENGLQHPELELTGPADFDVSSLEQWLHHDQVNGWTIGEVIYDHLRANNMLADCFGLSDLLSIQAKGLDFFRDHFKGKAPFAWKSVVRNHRDYLSVPYLIEDGGKVVLHWNWLGNHWDANDPAPRFAK